MIEKMKFLSITGPKSDIDRVVEQYLFKYEIHLENALSELRSVKDLRAYVETNPYKETLCHAQELISYLPDIPKRTVSPPLPEMSLTDASQAVEELNTQVQQLMDQKKELENQAGILSTSLNEIMPFTALDYDLSSILHFRFVKFRFGRISHEYYQKFEKYVYDSIDTVLYKCQEDADYSWLVYFVPASISTRVDAIYSSMHFERLFLQDEYEGTPENSVKKLTAQIEALKQETVGIEEQITAALQQNTVQLLAAGRKLEHYAKNFDIRKLAACTKQDNNTFYIICGWMTNRDATAFQQEIHGDEFTFCIVEDDHENVISQPPTKLRNLKLFQPFELFIQMYGLPAYHEMDPTILIAITYSVLFGFMFGDAGQGLCLMIGGYLLYRFKHLKLAAIISCCGCFSTIFGFLFGSFFGFENVIPALWLHPKTAMTNLPFIGNLNTVFVFAVAIGMGIILLTMFLNIVNSFLCHDPEHAWFDTNGLAGFLFYANMTLTLVLFMTGKTLPASILLLVMFAIPLLLIFFKEPLTAFIEKKTEVMPQAKGMFIVQGFFELFEVLLSYFSNTLSFVRVGAFSVSHAAMMEVVLMLAGAESSGSINWLVVILGNLFVCGMEGLIVGIQVLRLEYYELFSRFYRGTGREFKPYQQKQQKQ